MNALWGSLMVLANWVTLCNAHCYVIPNSNTPDDSLNECKDLSGVIHPLNSEWKTEYCEECSCGQDGINCCNIVATPVNYDTSKCQKIFNKETCSFTVVEQKNPEKSCFVGGWVL
ncbi:beta-microseminoprotein [Sturnira hondurensis]|uniref:beta-microseminoprotein n=1 Tax=Sturnira hondurensis TaxID=192404 RepID=UPI001879BD83|nr:beta-microseminoprotein [Sturnira hondurensis]